MHLTDRLLSAWRASRWKAGPLSRILIRSAGRKVTRELNISDDAAIAKLARTARSPCSIYRLGGKEEGRRKSKKEREREREREREMLF